MKYYTILHSTDPKICGPFPQVEDSWNSSYENLLEHFDRQYITADITLPVSKLYNRAKVSDLISGCSAEFMTNLLVSGKLKSILLKEDSSVFQSFQAPVEHRGSVFDDFWFVHPTKMSAEYIDFSKSLVVKGPFAEVWESDKQAADYKIDINNSAEFEQAVDETVYRETGDSSIRVRNLRLIINADTPHFIFLMFEERAVAYLVSEDLKEEIVNAGCAGIEFCPIEMSINEWYASQIEKRELARAKRRPKKA